MVESFGKAVNNFGASVSFAPPLGGIILAQLAIKLSTAANEKIFFILLKEYSKIYFLEVQT